MNLAGYLFFALIICLLVVTGILLVSFIRENFRKGQNLREGLLERIEMLRFKRMLKKRGINIQEYLHNVMIHEIEKQVRVCENCNQLDDCNAALGGAQNNNDLSFCPNDTALRQIKADLSDS